MEIKNYDLSLDIDYATLAYRGRVSIAIEGATPELTINSVGLKIHSVTALGKPLQWEEKTDAEELLIHDVPVGGTRVEIEFEGRVTEGNLAGFYKSRFNGGYILTTQFEATQARRLFPCLDHPAYKAVYNVDVAVEEGLVVIFNTPPEKESKRNDGKKWYRFQQTPRMSTYLLYLGVGRFFEVARKDGKLNVILALPEGKKATAEYALDHAGGTVTFFERYFGIPYPLPKLHLIAVPDTSFGGMENWGAITFQENSLLVDPATSALVKKRIVEVIAHEIAHQWFGDLVTMSWWNDIWLNESFATFMSYKAVDELHPEWNIWGDFYSDNMTLAFLWDSLHSTHSIERDVDRPAEINETFDEISYEKGASILRMVESYVGEEEFRRGVAAYLQRFQFSNASGGDLWKAIEEVTGVPIPRIVENWIRKKGYPIIDVKLDGEKMYLQQSRFLLYGRVPGELWPIPISIRVGKETKRFLMDTPGLTVELGPQAQDAVVNAGRTGFYRVRYPKDIMARHIARFREFPESERWGMVQDMYAFFLAGEVTIEEYLSLVDTCRGENSRLVVEEITGELGSLFPLVQGNEKILSIFRTFVSAQIDRIGRTARHGEPETAKALRERLALLLLFLDDKYAGELSKEFQHYDSVDPELRSSVAVSYAKFAAPEVHASLVQRFLNAPSETEASRMGMALMAFRQPEVLEKSLDLIADPKTGMGRGITLFQSAVAIATRTPIGREIVWRWFMKHVDSIMKVTLGSSLSSLLLQFYLPRGGIGKEEEVRRFMESKNFPGGEVGKAKGLELLTIYERIYLRLRYQ
jgi:tricorn protease interacting factor F2/3